MPALLLGLAILVALLLIGRWYSRAEPNQVATLVKATIIVLAIAVGVFLLLTGRAALAAVVPILAAMLWRMRGSLFARARAGFEGRRYGRESGVRARFVTMTLDHETGIAEGEVLEGRFTGRSLSSLTLEEAVALRDEAAGDAESLALLEAWLDRMHPAWREDGRDAPPPAGGMMTRAEAYAILGLPEDAAPEEIRAAHRRLMLKMHPDQGGSTWMAAKLNQAKDLLLGPGG